MYVYTGVYVEYKFNICHKILHLLVSCHVGMYADPCCRTFERLFCKVLLDQLGLQQHLPPPLFWPTLTGWYAQTVCHTGYYHVHQEHHTPVFWNMLLSHVTLANTQRY